LTKRPYPVECVLLQQIEALNQS